MTRKTLITTAVLAALGLGLVAGGTALARGPGGWGDGRPCHGMGGGGVGPAMFFHLDTDDDGTITKAEFDARHEARFKALDTDGDGVVTKAEVRDAMAKVKSRRGPWWDDDDDERR